MRVRCSQLSLFLICHLSFTPSPCEIPLSPDPRPTTPPPPRRSPLPLSVLLSVDTQEPTGVFVVDSNQGHSIRVSVSRNQRRRGGGKVSVINLLSRPRPAPHSYLPFSFPIRREDLFPSQSPWFCCRGLQPLSAALVLSQPCPHNLTGGRLASPRLSSVPGFSFSCDRKGPVVNPRLSWLSWEGNRG